MLMGCFSSGQVMNGSDPGSPSGPRSPDGHRQRAGGPGESSRPEGAEWSQTCSKQLCDVSANVGSADPSLVVAFVCKVNKSAAPVVSEENLRSPSSPLLAAASPQERELPGSSGQRAGFARVSVPPSWCFLP